MNFNTETYLALTLTLIAFAALCLAVCALLMAIRESRAKRRHDRLSVRPFLELEEDRYDINEEGVLIMVSLGNTGAGTAIIKNFVFQYDGKEISHNNEKAYKDFLKEKTKAFSEVSINHLKPGSMVEVDRYRHLLNFNHQPDIHDIDFLEKINFVIEYQSIYGDEDETFTYDFRKNGQYPRR